MSAIFIEGDSDMDGDSDIEGDADMEGDSDIEGAIALLEAEGALVVAGSAEAPPPQAASDSGKAIAAVTAAILVKCEVLDINFLLEDFVLLPTEGFCLSGSVRCPPPVWIGGAA